jgi:hypothetical protein
MKNTWTDRIGVRISQGRIVTSYGSLSGRVAWVEMSRSQFVGGRIVSATSEAVAEWFSLFPTTVSESLFSLILHLYAADKTVWRHVEVTLII